MRALLEGERKGTLLQVLILLAVSIGGVVSMYLTVHSAHRADAAQRRYQQTQYVLCLQTQTRRLALRQLEEADVQLQHTQIRIDEHNPVADPRVRAQRRAAWQHKLAADERYLNTAAPSCDKLRPGRSR